jgi:O-antigen ligase
MPIVSLPEVPVARSPTRAERLAVRVLQVGAVASVLVASTYRVFDLDRFFVPKEMVLHLTAAIVAVLGLSAVRRSAATRVDLILLAFLLVSAVSAGLATNVWAAMRALAISLSGVALFWSARGLRDAGLARPVLFGVAAAAVAAAVTCLLQAYGVRTDFFSLNRSPGGTLGNRNFIAHLIALSLPLLLLSALRAWRNLGFALGAAGTAISLWALILTRSRAAWLGVIVVLAVLAVGSLICRPVRRDRRFLWRTGVLLLIAGGGVASALLLPNALDWRSDSPYLETARGVVNYREGSGRGRLIQYRTSLSVLAADPLLGAGPGNWQVEYPDHAGEDDPSLDRSAPVMTANPWPSSDWVAFLTERGVLGAGLLLLGVVGIVIASWRRLLTARDAEEGLSAVTCLAVIAGTATVGAFDAVLLLGWPTLVVWTAIGALWTPETARGVAAAPAARATVVAVLAFAAGAASIRSMGQLSAMGIFAGEPGRSGLELAATLDPGNYRVRMAAARSYGAREEGRCEHARAAHGLFPNSRAARSLAAPCD